MTYSLTHSQTHTTTTGTVCLWGSAHRGIIKNSDGLINVIQTIAAGDYETVGMYLLKDDNGKKVKLLIKEDDKGAESHTKTILQSWLDDGALLHTYRYLIECLEKAEMGAFTGHVKSKVSKNCKLIGSKQQYATHHLYVCSKFWSSRV